MDSVFAWIEGSALSAWIRETPSIFAYPAIITLHVIGIGFLAGGSTAIDLRILGFAPRIRLAAMQNFFPALWLAFALNVVTGTLLLIGYPTKALTNPVFYIKLVCIALAVTLLHKIRIEVLLDPQFEQRPPQMKSKILAGASLLLWVATIAAGRYLGYTYAWELVGVRAIL